MQSSKGAKKPNRGHFGWLYKVFCEKKSVKPLPAVQACSQDDCLRFSVDHVALKDWSPILNSIAGNRSLSKIYIYSRSRRRKIREKINTEEKLEKLWRCGTKDHGWPIVYTNFLLRCLVDSVAVFARDSSTITWITLDGIPLAPKYLNILCSGLKKNEMVMNLSLAKCRIGDVGCDLLLGCLRNNPKLSALNLSSCRLTNRSAMCLSLFLKRRKADLLQNVWETPSPQSPEENSGKESQGLHTLNLSKNPKFGDNGVRHLTYALKSDFWLKSLSLHACGITKHGGQLILELLQRNGVITRVDLTGNHVPINTLQILLRTLKRRREMGESVSLKRRLFFGWRNTSSRNFSRRDRLRGTLSKDGRRTMTSSFQERPRKASLRNHRAKRFERRTGGSKGIRSTKKEDFSRARNLRDLESKLSSTVDSNCTLREQLSSNKALLEAEAQERSKVENELQKVSTQFDDLKSKVTAFHCLRTKACGESELLEVLRYVFEKLRVFSALERQDGRWNEGEEEFSTSTRRRAVANSLQRPYCPLKT